MSEHEPTIFVGMRVSELPRPYVPSFRLRCKTCQEEVWVSKMLVKQAFASDRVVCVECALIEIEREQANGKRN